MRHRVLRAPDRLRSSTSSSARQSAAKHYCWSIPRGPLAAYCHTPPQGLARNSADYFRNTCWLTTNPFSSVQRKSTPVQAPFKRFLTVDPTKDQRDKVVESSSMEESEQSRKGKKESVKVAAAVKREKSSKTVAAEQKGEHGRQVTKKLGYQTKRRDRERMDLEPKYEAYWDRARIDAAIAEGKVALGSFHMLPNNRKNIGFVRLQNGSGPDVYIEGLESRNRAMDGDFVAVELGSEIERRADITHPNNKTPKLELEYTDEAKEAADDLWAPAIKFADKETREVLQASASARNETQKQRTGKIVSVLAVATGGTMSGDREFTAKHVGRLVAACDPKRLQPGRHLDSSETFAYFVPSDTRVPRIKIPRGELPYEFIQDPLVHSDQVLYLGKLLSWNANEKEPTGILLGRLGQAGEIATETEAFLMEYGVNHGEFPQSALDCLKEFLPPRDEAFEKPSELWWKIPEEEFKKRLDLRNTLIFTVDPYTAKDIDDALHCTPMPDGTFEMGVHIADVSYFVKPGSALDEEALRRSTSVYLVQKVIPMLPALLSEELCSLNPNVDRLAFSCIWRMKANGELCPQHQPWFGRTIIRSACKLHYGLAQDIIDNGPDCEGWNEPGRVPEQGRWTRQQVCESLQRMNMIGMARRKLRFDPERGGALEMQTRKMTFELNKETGNPVGVRDYPLYDTNRLIEEYMLLANYLVAQRLIQYDRKNAFLRHHPPPDTKEMQKMVEILRRSSGVSFFDNGKISPSAIQKALRSLRSQGALDEEAEAAEESSLKVVASELLKKPMKNAQYFVASDLDEQAWRHWALNIKYYTHFTSPIRRYADVCVHRELADALLGPQNARILVEEDTIKLRNAAQRCNEKKDASRHAQDASDLLYLNLLIRDRVAKKTPLEIRAVVLDLGPKSFTAFMPELGISKRVHVQDDLGWAVLKVHTLNHEGSNGSHQAGEREVASHASKKSSKANNDNGDDSEKDVIGLRVALLKDKITLDLKILSELTLALVPREHADKRGGLDFRLVPTSTTANLFVDKGLAQALAAADEHMAVQQVRRSRGNNRHGNNEDGKGHVASQKHGHGLPHVHHPADASKVSNEAERTSHSVKPHQSSAHAQGDRGGKKRDAPTKDGRQFSTSAAQLHLDLDKMNINVKEEEGRSKPRAAKKDKKRGERQDEAMNIANGPDLHRTEDGDGRAVTQNRPKKSSGNRASSGHRDS